MSLWQFRQVRAGFVAFHSPPKIDDPAKPVTNGKLATLEELDMALQSYGHNKGAGVFKARAEAEENERLYGLPVIKS